MNKQENNNPDVTGAPEPMGPNDSDVRSSAGGSSRVVKIVAGCAGASAGAILVLLSSSSASVRGATRSTRLQWEQRSAEITAGIQNAQEVPSALTSANRDPK